MALSESGFHLTPIGTGVFLFEPARSLNIRDSDSLMDAIIGRLHAVSAQRLYYDLASVPLIDRVYYNWLNTLARACQAVNVKMICIHIQPTAAYSLTQVMDGAPAFATALDVNVRSPDE